MAEFTITCSMRSDVCATKQQRTGPCIDVLLSSSQRSLVELALARRTPTVQHASHRSRVGCTWPAFCLQRLEACWSSTLQASARSGAAGWRCEVVKGRSGAVWLVTASSAWIRHGSGGTLERRGKLADAEHSCLSFEPGVALCVSEMPFMRRRALLQPAVRPEMASDTMLALPSPHSPRKSLKEESVTATLRVSTKASSQTPLQVHYCSQWH